MMAEPVSAVVALTTLSLAITKKTVLFIEDARDVDKLVKKLSASLIDLRRLIKMVEFTCRNATSVDNDPYNFIESTLRQCYSRLQGVETIVQDLASRSTVNFLNKVALKVRSDRSKREVNEAIQDIEHLMDNIHKSISCWILQKVSAAPAVQPLHTQPDVPADIENYTPGTLEISLSKAETVYLNESISSSRRESLTTEASYRPASSTLARPRVSSTHRREGEHTEPEGNFHYQIRICHSHPTRLPFIKRTLLSNPHLVHSVDGFQRCPLHIAAQLGNIPLGKLFLEFGADINAKDSQPSSILDLALAANREEFVIFLLENNVNDKAISKRNQYCLDEIRETMDLRREEEKRIARKARK